MAGLSPTTVSSISLVKAQLHVCFVANEDVERVALPLLELLLGDSPVLFSLTAVDGGLTLVLETRHWDRFPRGSLQTSGHTWRAIQVALGSAGFTGTGVVMSCSKPLAAAKIPIFYVSTASTDFILIPEPKFPAAIQAMQAVSFAVEMDDIDEEFLLRLSGGAAAAEAATAAATATATATATHLVESTGGASTTATTTVAADAAAAPPEAGRRFRMQAARERVYLFGLRPDQMRTVTRDVLRKVFFGHRQQAAENHFATLTWTEDELSLLLDVAAARVLRELDITSQDSWLAFERKGKLGFTETGVVAQLSAPLATANIPILYLSTFPSAFVLVQAKEADRARQVWRGTDFVEVLPDRE